MARPKKNRITLNIRPEDNVMERFAAYCDEVGQTKTLAFERIISSYINQYEEDKKQMEKLKQSL